MRKKNITLTPEKQVPRRWLESLVYRQVCPAAGHVSGVLVWKFLLQEFTARQAYLVAWGLNRTYCGRAKLEDNYYWCTSYQSLARELGWERHAVAHHLASDALETIILQKPVPKRQRPLALRVDLGAIRGIMDRHFSDDKQERLHVLLEHFAKNRPEVKVPQHLTSLAQRMDYTLSWMLRHNFRDTGDGIAGPRNLLGLVGFYLADAFLAICEGRVAEALVLSDVCHRVAREECERKAQLKKQIIKEAKASKKGKQWAKQRMDEEFPKQDCSVRCSAGRLAKRMGMKRREVLDALAWLRKKGILVGDLSLKTTGHVWRIRVKHKAYWLAPNPEVMEPRFLLQQEHLDGMADAKSW